MNQHQHINTADEPFFLQSKTIIDFQYNLNLKKPPTF